MHATDTYCCGAEGKAVLRGRCSEILDPNVRVADLADIALTQQFLTQDARARSVAIWRAQNKSQFWTL